MESSVLPIKWTGLELTISMLYLMVTILMINVIFQWNWKYLS